MRQRANQSAKPLARFVLFFKKTVLYRKSQKHHDLNGVLCNGNRPPGKSAEKRIAAARKKAEKNRIS
jgi:hypothetical protein